ncbi:MCE family protein [Mycobacterium branderi]|uniref:Virulence factor Mce n=1 Tax=Mycobacterium branderi TaxID=43348 RepID=A0ABN6B6N4_9MYCO|nr:MCE family protein [Mycobacterium branderi]MCV7230906.1 MCE family protein [Mycobacterium branderi]BBZ12198.1 virulence factor Mce [Mycobacterium branderi]
MTVIGTARRLLVIGSCVVLTATGCAFQGLNSLPLPGAVGRGPAAQVFHVEIPNVGTMESNSPVMIDDVVVGSVAKMTVQGWHADVEVGVRPDVVVPANAVAKVGQTSLLGSMHLELNPPLGQPAIGRLKPGATIPLSKSSSYPSTEQTLASLSVIVNSGGLGQIGDVIHNFSGALSGREGEVRDLLTRLDDFVGTFDDQRDNVVASIQALNRVAGTFAGQRDVIARALREISPSLDVLLKERPQITTALEKLGVFSDTATRLVNDTQTDLVKNLQNLAPTFCSLAEVGPDLAKNIAFAGSAFPYGQNLIDRGVRGDYFNVFVIIDMTRSRLKQQTFIGTHWQQKDLSWVPAPGDPGYDAFYTKFPNGDGVTGLPRTPPPPDPCGPNTPAMTGGR